MPFPLWYGTFVEGRSGAGGALWYGNVAGGAVPVPYRCGIVRSRVDMDFGTLIVGNSNAGGTIAGTIFVPYGLSVYASDLCSLVRWIIVGWYVCGTGVVMG